MIDWLQNLYETKRNVFMMLCSIAIYASVMGLLLWREVSFIKQNYDKKRHREKIWDLLGNMWLASFLIFPIIFLAVGIIIDQTYFIRHELGEDQPPQTKRESLVEPTPKQKQRDTVYIFVQPQLKKKTIIEEYK